MKQVAPKSLPRRAAWRIWLYEVIFEADTPAGRLFDIGLLIAILASVTAISLETVESIEQHYRDWLTAIEWTMTILFTIEYVLRLICVPRPKRYALSFLGLVDLVSILPAYLGVFFGGAHAFGVLRTMRLLRVFRILKLVRFLHEADELRRAVWNSRDKIVVFLTTVLVAVTITGTLMYQIESGENKEQFESIPQSMYWAIVTMTTVGYGDIVPKTTLGKMLSAALILLGYSLIIVPTGFVSAELMQHKSRGEITTTVCHSCFREGHDQDARYCKYCGQPLDAEPV